MVSLYNNNNNIYIILNNNKTKMKTKIKNIWKDKPYYYKKQYYNNII